jgi:hypothetical protein
MRKFEITRVPPPPKKFSEKHVFVSKLVFIYVSSELYEVFSNALSHKIRPHRIQLVFYYTWLIN